MLGPNAGSDQKVGCTLLPVGRATGAHFSLSVFPTQFAFSVLTLEARRHVLTAVIFHVLGKLHTETDQS